MVFHLRLEISAMNRHEPTLGNDTLKRLFFAMDLLVFLESISTAAHKTARFMGTSIHLPVLMYSHMFFQIAGGDRRVAASRHGALKRLFAGVGSNMDFKIAVVRRGVRTVRIGAFQRLFAGVGSDVDDEDAARDRRIVAVGVGAFIRLFAGVGAEVRLHIALADRRVAAAFKGAVELLRRNYIKAARTAVVVAATGAHGGVRGRRHSRCLCEGEEFSRHNY